MNEIKKDIKLWLYRCLLRILAKNRAFWRNNILHPKSEISENQEIAIAIVKKAIAHPEAELLMAPITGSRYIRYKEIFIGIENCFITIINGTYSYHVSVPEKSTNQLNEKFNFRLEYIRKNWEDAIQNKTKRSLSTILEEFHNI